ncbi:MAG: DUF2378 family protein [Deltaproteobacteria bacterium]|nr:DUF2378 family protein [Deltaproteobacteria bacterium]
MADIPPSYLKASLFEGLFGELKPTGAFADELKAAGWDPAKMQIAYPDPVWGACVRCACRHVHPNLSEEQAERELGRTWIRGFGRTLTGRLALAVLPALSGEKFIDYIPKIVRLVSSAMTMEIVAREEKARLVRFTTPPGDATHARFHLRLHRRGNGPSRRGRRAKGRRLLAPALVVSVWSLRDTEGRSSRVAAGSITEEGLSAHAPGCLPCHRCRRNPGLR